MSQLADINDDFDRAINKGVGSEEDAWLVADAMICKGFAVESYHTRNFGA